ncbi:MAG: hypothetical protein GC186_09115 [Rhodobacteraceae bacterium]|nr:hypothetical protein [Paracoccaceae bacterium]
MKGISVTTGLAGRRDAFWLDQNFSMMASSPARGLGFNLRLGGTFTSVPVAVASTVLVNPVLSTLGTDQAVAKTSASPAPAPAAPAAGSVAARAAPAATAASRVLHGGAFVQTQRLDIFGLGRDYAMYHKSYVGTHDSDDLSGWQGLGGVFTSAPAAIAWDGGRIDVFGVGMDHALYTRTLRGNTWTPNWESLGGTFTSTASMVSRSATQLDVFARGADFTLRGNQSDGTSWFGWQNHGGQLASPPVAISWGPDRIDVFAVFNDKALWHIWWDGQIWNEWESLGGSYFGEPAAVTWAPGRLDVFLKGSDGNLHHHWFENNIWAVPEILNYGSTSPMAESPTAVSAAPNQIDVYVPTDDARLRILSWNGAIWGTVSAGAQFRMPSRYRMSVDYVRADRARSLNADTDAASATVSAGNLPNATVVQWIGDIGGTHPQTSQTNLLYFDDIAVDLAEPMSFSYIVVNNGHADQSAILASLQAAGNGLGGAGTTSMEEDIAKGVVKFVETKLTGALSVSIPVLGSVLGAIEGWLLGKLNDIIFAKCDGLVAVEMRAMMGRDLFLMTDSGTKTFTTVTTHQGTDSATGCGANSIYEVTWTIKPL